MQMLIEIMKSKVHGATITEANLEYTGSLTLDATLMEKAGMIPGEKVQVVNANNGERIETYLIKGLKDSGVCCLNGPAARKGMKGDKVVIITYAMVPVAEAKDWIAPKVFVDKENKPINLKEIASE